MMTVAYDLCIRRVTLESKADGTNRNVYSRWAEGSSRDPSEVLAKAWVKVPPHHGLGDTPDDEAQLCYAQVMAEVVRNVNDVLQGGRNAIYRKGATMGSYRRPDGSVIEMEMKGRVLKVRKPKKKKQAVYRSNGSNIRTVAQWAKVSEDGSWWNECQRYAGRYRKCIALRPDGKATIFTCSEKGTHSYRIVKQNHAPDKSMSAEGRGPEPGTVVSSPAPGRGQGKWASRKKVTPPMNGDMLD